MRRQQARGIRGERRFASLGIAGLERAAAQSHALEPAHDGPARRCLPELGATDLGGQRTQAASDPNLHSWLNLVERFFRQLADDAVREGSFASVGELITAINVHLAHHNLSPKPYRWKTQGAAIVEKSSTHERRRPTLFCKLI